MSTPIFADSEMTSVPRTGPNSSQPFQRTIQTSPYGMNMWPTPENPLPAYHPTQYMAPLIMDSMINTTPLGIASSIPPPGTIVYADGGYLAGNGMSCNTDAQSMQYVSAYNATATSILTGAPIQSVPQSPQSQLMKTHYEPAPKNKYHFVAPNQRS